MSKGLESEYRALVNNDVPDLWARIEAGLDEKEDSGERIECSSIIKKAFPVKVWATVAAACVCVGLIVPVMKGRMTGMNENSSNMAPQSDFIADGAGLSYEMSDSSKAADGDMLSDNVIDNTKNAVTAEAAAYDGGDAAEEAAAEEINTFRTVVEIIGTDIRMDSKIVYMAKVLSCENPDLQENSEIRIVVSILSDDEMSLEKGVTYELTLYEDNSGEETAYSIVK